MGELGQREFLSCLFLSAALWSLALLYVMFNCVFVTFPYGVLGQVWYLIAPIPDLCLLTYFLILQMINNSVIVMLSLH